MPALSDPGARGGDRSDQDAYAEGTGLGVAPANAAPWDKTAAGIDKMWGDLDHSTAMHREKASAARRSDADVFYQERKKG